MGRSREGDSPVGLSEDLVLRAVEPALVPIKNNTRALKQVRIGAYNDISCRSTTESVSVNVQVQRSGCTSRVTQSREKLTVNGAAGGTATAGGCGPAGGVLGVLSGRLDGVLDGPVG